MEKELKFSLEFSNFAETEGKEGEFEGILVNYKADELAHGLYKFKKGSMKVNEGKTLFVLYNHNGDDIPVGTMTGEDKEDGFHIKAKLSLEKDEGGYVNKAAAALYNLMKSGAPFELSTGGWIKRYTVVEKKECRTWEIEEFDAYEGSVTPRGAVKGSKITKVFNNKGDGNKMDEKMFKEMLETSLKELQKEIFGAKNDEEIKALPEKFKEIEKNFSEMKETFTKETLEGFEIKFNELNDVIKGLKQDYAASKEEVTAAEEFASMIGVVMKKGQGVTEKFTLDNEIIFASSPGTSTTHDKTIKPTYVTKILERIQAANPVLADIPFLSITDGSLYVPREMLGLPTTGWVGETDNRSETDITGIDNVTIQLYQLYAMPVVSNRLMATNFVGYVNFLMKRTEYALSLALANAALNGTGTNMPKGILKETGIGSAEIDTTDDTTFVDSLISAYYSVRSEISAGAKWYMTRGTWAAIAKLKNASKDFYITDLNTGNTRTLMTRPVVIIEDENAGLKDVATATATTDPVILFADLGMAMQGIQNNGLDIMIKDQITTKGLTKFYMEKLLGIGTQLPEYAVKIVKKA